MRDCRSYCAMKRLLQIALLVSALAAHAEEPAGVRRSPTSASRGCSASAKARCSTRCPSTSATGSARSAIREALRALNDTGFFRDVELRRDESAAGGGGAGASDHPHLRRQGQQGHQDRGPDRSRCATSVSPAARSSTATCSRTCASTSSTSTSRAATTTCASTCEVEEQPETWSTCTWTSTKARSRASGRSTWWATSASATRNCSRAWSSRRTTCCRSTAGDDRYSRQALAGRPGEAALLLHGSRLRGLRDHLDAGGAGAREG